MAVPGSELALVLHLPEGGERVACVVACHGLRASKDSEKYLLLASELPAAGFALARFDFRGCGESSGREEDTTVGTRVEDARAVLAALHGHPRLGGRFGLLGSSMGGFVALCLAAERGDGRPVVTWNAPANFSDLADRPTVEGEGLGVPFFEEQAAGRYGEAPHGVAGHLVIQAEADDVVPLEHGVLLHERAAAPCDIVIVAGADHRLSDTVHRREAVARSLEWFKRYLE
ncbi:MAG: alpha/beta fold hydrolase [Candidatus Rokubacteria bacterium]|nr:alpha/beta fold hydrolase [Candidatus Rokubacteria bacterium]MBI3827366.1 alpha/beta fold hydrolase [Candidatus Rokubacteria bacterium]